MRFSVLGLELVGFGVKDLGFRFQNDLCWSPLENPKHMHLESVSICGMAIWCPIPKTPSRDKAVPGHLYLVMLWA